MPVSSRLLIRTLAQAAAVALLPTLVPIATANANSAKEPARQFAYKSWDAPVALEKGTAKGTAQLDGQIVFRQAQGTRKLGGTTYERATWISPVVSPGFAATELIPSWVAKTPGRSWIRVDLRGTTATGASTGWDTISRWALRDTYVQRTSLGKQPNGGAHVAYDTWVIPKGVTKWQLRVVLFRKAGSANAPSIDQIGAIASKSATTVATTSKPTGLAAGKVLDVPKYSQMTHTGRYPQYGGGGVAWCSPTSVSMVLGYYQALPKPAAYAWVNGNGATRFVDHAARMTYDAGLRGTGNWPFNTAYAASLTGKAFVTRLPNLRAAERRIAAGTPLVVSIAFSRGQLKGAPIGSTSGHLLVIVGFTKSGDVVVNDPAAPKASGVRRTYDRAQFEAAWQRRSGGLTYVITK